MKYKVGDKVRVKDLVWYVDNKNEYDNVGEFVKQMQCYCGSEQTISYISENYYKTEESDNWHWTDDMFEDGVVEESIPTGNDPINPDHYKQGKVECIDAIESATTNLKGGEAVCTAQIIKYIWRWKAKNGLEDLKKVQWYLNRLVTMVDK